MDGPGGDRGRRARPQPAAAVPGMFDWAEPGNVAAALAEGRGFSDPFDGAPGATAWVSPLPVWVEAAVFLALGVKTAASAKAMLVLAVLGLAGANALLASALAPYGAWMRGRPRPPSSPYCALLPGGPLEVLSEAWLDILLSAALLWAALETAGARPGGRGARRADRWLAWPPSRTRGSPSRSASSSSPRLAAAGTPEARRAGRRGGPRRGFRRLLDAPEMRSPSPPGAPQVELLVRAPPRQRRLGGRAAPGWRRCCGGCPTSTPGSSTATRASARWRYVESFRAPALARCAPTRSTSPATSCEALGARRVLPREGGGQPDAFRFARGRGPALGRGRADRGRPDGRALDPDRRPPSAEPRSSTARASGTRPGSWRDWMEKRLAYDASSADRPGSRSGS
jgi:hypothetical protein